MKWMLLLLVFALMAQLGLFVYSRRLKKANKNSMIEKYNLRKPKDAWDALANPDIPEEDKEEIRKLYEGEE